MRVLILAAGLGTRLRPITNKIPKCLVEVGGKPMLEHWLDKLSNTQITPKEVYINLHYKKKQVETFLQSYDSKFPIYKIFEKELRGTGGTFLSLIEKKFDDDLLVIHCDNFYDAGLDDFLTKSQSVIRDMDFDLALLAFQTKDKKNCGTMEVDKDGKILRFWEKKETSPSNLANGAIYFFSKKIIYDIREKRTEFRDIANDLIQPLNRKIFCYKAKDYFCDVGTLSSLNDTRKYCLAK